MDSNTIKLNDKQTAVVLARVKAGRDKVAERDKNHDDDASAYPNEGARNIALLAGTYWTTQNKPEIRSVNHMAPVAISKFGLITNGKREFVVSSTKPRFDELEDIARGLMNHSWRAYDLENDCKRAYWDLFALKFGVVEIGWKFVDEDDRETRGARPDIKVPDDAESIIAPDGTMQKPQPQEFASEEEALRASEIADEKIPRAQKNDEPFIERFDPRDLLVDPQCVRPDLSDARYVFRRKTANVDDLKRNPFYSNKKEIKSTGTSYAGKPENGTMALRAPDDAKADFETTTVYDGYAWIAMKPGQSPKFLHIVIAEGMQNALLCEEFVYDWKAKNPYPFELITNWQPSNDDLQFTSDVSQTRWLQVEHDESYTQVSKVRRRTANKLMGPEIEESDPVVEQLESNEEGIYVALPEQMVDRVRWLERPQQNIEAYKFLESVPEIMRGQWGVNEFQLNDRPDRKMLAAEVNMMGSQGGTRQESDLEAYNNFCCRCAYKVLALLQQFSNQTRHFSYTNKGGEKTWGQATLESLRGVDPTTNELEPVGIQFAIEIDADGTGNRNKYSERKELSEMMQKLAPLQNMQDPFRPGLPLINTANLVREYIKRYDITNAGDIIAPEPSEDDKLVMALQFIKQLSDQLQSTQAKLQQLEASSAPPMAAVPPAPMAGARMPGGIMG